MPADTDPSMNHRVSDTHAGDSCVCDSGGRESGIWPRATRAGWLLVAAFVALAGAVAGRLHAARAAEDAPPARGSEAGDALGRLDRVVEKLDRLIDRLGAERMGPQGPPPPPHHGPANERHHAPERHHGPERHDGHAERREAGPHGEDGGGAGHRPGGPERGPMPGPISGPMPGMPGPRPSPGRATGPWGEERPGRPDQRGGMPAEMRDIMQRRMEEAQRRMREAQERYRELEERVRKLEAEVERLRSA